VLRTCRAELATLERDVSKLEDVARGGFPRVTYAEAAKILVDMNSGFVPGNDFGAPDEQALATHFGRPVFIHRWPAEIKAFYMKRDPNDASLALGVDMIAPEGYGEIIGGGQRAEDLDFLLEQIKLHQLPQEAFEWYLDLRRYGTVPHAGFGLWSRTYRRVGHGARAHPRVHPVPAHALPHLSLISETRHGDGPHDGACRQGRVEEGGRLPSDRDRSRACGPRPLVVVAVRTRAEGGDPRDSAAAYGLAVRRHEGARRGRGAVPPPKGAADSEKTATPAPAPAPVTPPTPAPSRETVRPTPPVPETRPAVATSRPSVVELETQLAALRKDPAAADRLRRALGEAVLVDTYPESLRRTWMDELRPLTKRFVWSAAPMPGASVGMKVQNGDNLTKVAERARREHGVNVAPDFIRVVNDLPPNFVRAGATLKIPTEPTAIVVDKSEFRVYLTLGGAVIRDWPIGIGRDERTPEGVFKTGNKTRNPTWTDPETGKTYKYGDPGHTIGSRWISFDDGRGRTGFGIHGTNEPASIGKAESAGCARMLAADVEELFDLVPPGIEIVVRS
jgi:lipoprotein-anchoring transpeptidase ErfK/SrfK